MKIRAGLIILIALSLLRCIDKRHGQPTFSGTSFVDGSYSFDAERQHNERMHVALFSRHLSSLAPDPLKSPPCVYVAIQMTLNGDGNGFLPGQVFFMNSMGTTADQDTMGAQIYGFSVPLHRPNPPQQGGLCDTWGTKIHVIAGQCTLVDYVRGASATFVLDLTLSHFELDADAESGFSDRHVHVTQTVTARFSDASVEGAAGNCDLFTGWKQGLGCRGSD